MEIRYIRDWLATGSNVYPGDHWIEIEAYSNGENIALGKTVTISEGALTGWIGTDVVTDGILGNFVQVIPHEGKSAIQVDLEGLFDVQEVIVWHYYADGRIYYGTKTEVSSDGIKWITIFDSGKSGEYAETPQGHSIPVIAPVGTTGEINLPTIQEITTSDVTMIDLAQTISRHGIVSFDLFQRITKSDSIPINLGQIITQDRFIVANLSQAITREYSIQTDLKQAITRDDLIRVNLGQIINRTDFLSVDLLQIFIQTDSLSINLSQAIVRDGIIQVNLSQIFDRTDSLQVNLGQTITRIDMIQVDVNQSISKNLDESMSLAQVIYRNNQSIINLEQRFIFGDELNLYTKQTITRTGEINLGLNQQIIIVTTGEINLGFNQTIYDPKETSLEVLQIIKKDIVVPITLRQETFIQNGIIIDMDIFMVDYFTYIGEIPLHGRRELLQPLEGNVDLSVPIVGNVETYLSRRGAIDMTMTGQDFSMIAGDTKILIVTMDEPMNMGGVSLKWGIRKNKNAKESLFVKTMTDGITVEGDSISVKLEPSDTQLIAGDFYHEMELTDGLGNVSTIFVGKVRIETSGV